MVDFGAVVGFVGTGLTGAVVVVVVPTSESSSLPLPYPSTPSMVMVDLSRLVARFTSRVVLELTFCHNTNKNNGDIPGTNAGPKEDQQAKLASTRLLATSRSTPPPKTTRDSEYWTVQPASYLPSYHSCTKYCSESYPR